MHPSAGVSSIEALREFRAALCCFKEDAQEALAAVDMEIRRTLDWLEDQVKYWQREVRERQEEVVQAKNDLARRKLERVGGRPPDCTEQEEALWLAQQRLREAEEMVERARRWRPQLQHAVDEYLAPARQLANLVEGDLPRAFALLDQKIGVLESYLALAAPVSFAPGDLDTGHGGPNQDQRQPGRYGREEVAMSVSVGRTKLYNALKTARVRWEETQAVWNDPVREDFERTYWLPLEPQVEATLRAMDRLDQILAKARQECA